MVLKSLDSELLQSNKRIRNFVKLMFSWGFCHKCYCIIPNALWYSFFISASVSSDPTIFTALILPVKLLTPELPMRPIIRSDAVPPVGAFASVVDPITSPFRKTLTPVPAESRVQPTITHSSRLTEIPVGKNMLLLPPAFSWKYRTESKPEVLTKSRLHILLSASASVPPSYPTIVKLVSVTDINLTMAYTESSPRISKVLSTRFSPTFPSCSKESPTKPSPYVGVPSRLDRSRPFPLESVPFP